MRFWMKGAWVPDLRAVLFDLDGVLVDSYEAWFKVVCAAARHFRKPDIARGHFEKCWGQGLDADMREFFPGCHPQQVQAYYEDHLLDFDGDIRVDETAATTLERLRDADVLRGIVTNTPTDLARDILAWAGLIGMVDVTVGASSAIPPKPAPDVILGACRMLDVEPAQALVVGDSPFDAQAAEAARARFVGFRTGKDGSVAALPEVAGLVRKGDGT